MSLLPGNLFYLYEGPGDTLFGERLFDPCKGTEDPTMCCERESLAMSV